MLIGTSHVAGRIERCQNPQRRCDETEQDAEPVDSELEWHSFDDLINEGELNELALEHHWHHCQNQGQLGCSSEKGAGLTDVGPSTEGNDRDDRQQGCKAGIKWNRADNNLHLLSQQGKKT